VDFYNFSYTKISKKRNIKWKKIHDPHYSAHTSQHYSAVGISIPVLNSTGMEIPSKIL
jgi:hypothetical protein